MRATRGRMVIGAACLVLVGGAAVIAPSRPAAHPVLLMQGIAQDPCAPQDVFAVPDAVRGQYEPGSSVLRVAGGVYSGRHRTAPMTRAEKACVRATARASRQWLAAGIVPGTGAQLRSMAERALLDLRLSARPDGAVVAGWQSIWQYAWPRDCSWVAAALADTGHPADALRILRFLQRVQLPDGTWAARYRPDGSGPVRDGRPDELDAVGWVPWAVWSWLQAKQPADPAVRRQLLALWPMVEAAADAAVRSLSPDGLPRPAMDYWEHSLQVTLGTAAPLLAGLRAAADLARVLAAPALAQRWGQAAAALSGRIAGSFGRTGYHRLPDGRSGADAAVTFLGPPFAAASPAVARAAGTAERALTVPGGGLRPGTSRPGNPSVAWTAETAFFALFDASAGQRGQAGQLLSWLAAHRTRLGALPEQVSGGPVSVAPLAWTDAVVLLALLAQSHHLAVVPVPAP